MEKLVSVKLKELPSKQVDTGARPNVSVKLKELPSKQVDTGARPNVSVKLKELPVSKLIQVQDLMSQ
jgi:hypothetical protein